MSVSAIMGIVKLISKFLLWNPLIGDGQEKLYPLIVFLNNFVSSNLLSWKSNVDAIFLIPLFTPKKLSLSSILYIGSGSVSFIFLHFIGR